ncbi:2',3'-cyclic-nucleotide 3'-phosphodiesterase [Kalaharituber pfeilii]|nr:2',3'-cyclic-nucleotide 3'-phosphodiesterase [Kalaharituber pfeilii]
MGGSSLWLIPPAESEIDSKLSTLINITLPSLMPDIRLPHFRPHITLTSEVSPALDPTTVTSSIEVQTPPDVKFHEVNVGTTFFTRVTLHLEKTAAIKALAADCRKKYVTNGDEEAAKRWSEEDYVPHLSLIYAEQVPGAELVARINEEVAKAGIQFDVESWKGGRIALVNCAGSVEEWVLEGERTIEL